MKRHRSHRDGPGGSIQLTTRKVSIGNVEVIGRKARIIVRLKAMPKHLQRFSRLRTELGLDAIKQDAWGTTFDVCGTVESLESLVSNGCVLDWNYALNCRGPR